MEGNIMIINEENFPLYPLLLINNHSGAARAQQEHCVEAAKQDFQAAQSGDDEAIYNFVLGVQTVALWPAPVPGRTEEIVEKTLQSSRAVFEELASRGHKDAQSMRDYYDANGIGLPNPKAGSSVTQSKPHP